MGPLSLRRPKKSVGTLFSHLGSRQITLDVKSMEKHKLLCFLGSLTPLFKVYVSFDNHVKADHG